MIDKVLFQKGERSAAQLKRYVPKAISAAILKGKA